MTHCSLFKEAAQRIVQNAQSSQNDALSPALKAAVGMRSAPPAQMSGSTFSPRPLTSPTDTSAVIQG